MLMYHVYKYLIIAAVIEHCFRLKLESFVFRLPLFHRRTIYDGYSVFVVVQNEHYRHYYNNPGAFKSLELYSSVSLTNDFDDEDIYSISLKKGRLSNPNYDGKHVSHDLSSKYNLIQDIITDKSSRDNNFCSKLHFSTIKALIQSDKEHHLHKESDDHLPCTGIPVTYLTTIDFMRNITSYLTNTHHPCEKLVKIILKKESMSKYISLEASVATTQLSIRELIDLERRIERALSLILLTLFTHKQYAQSDASRASSYIFFSRLLLEKLTTHEKHLAMIILSRGILATGFNYSPAKHALDVQGLYRSSTNQGHDGLQSAFLSGMSHFDMSSPGSNYKLLFPFASACLRSFYRSDIYPTTVDGGGESDREASMRSEMAEAGFSGCVEEWKLCRMFRSLYRFDLEASNNHGLTDQTDDLLIYMRRWITELVSIHFINDDSNLYGIDNREALAEEVRTNTVAMELLCTNDAFVVGLKSNRKRYNHVMIEIGRYLNVMCTMTEELGQGTITDEDEDGGDDDNNNGDVNDGSGAEPLLLAKVKKLMMVISSLKWLPLSSKVRKAIEQKFDLKKRHDLYSIIPATSAERSRDDALFYGDGLTSNHRHGIMTGGGSLEDRNLQLIAGIDKLLLHSIGELLELSPETMRSLSVIEEVDSIFSTWRRPYLLFDYYKMHSTNKDIRPLYLRFLKALFGISDETFDDVRYKDPLNRRHLDQFDPLLVKQWIDGRTTDGIVLPGYNDPQTFIMIGEDTHTCMTIRSRQKGTNRGLLSILLNGSCRIVGVKDSAGRLLSRAIVRLLVDELTSRPVLFVDTPYGLHDSSADCSIDVYDQAAELGRLLHVPVVYAQPPPVDDYALSDFETSAVVYKVDTSSEHGDVDEGGSGDSEHYSDDHIVPLCNLLDRSTLAPYMWVNGVLDHRINRYLPSRSPRLIPMVEKNLSIAIAIDGNVTEQSPSLGIVMGVRPEGFIERLSVYYSTSIDRDDELVGTDDRNLFDEGVGGVGHTVDSHSIESSTRKINNVNVDVAASASDDDDLFFDSVRASSNARRTSVAHSSNKMNQRGKCKEASSSRGVAATASDSKEDVIGLLSSKKSEELAETAKRRNLRSVQYRQFMRQQTLLIDRNSQRDNRKITNNNTSSETTTTTINTSRQPVEDDDEFFYPIFDRD